jgi:hypothetical protein
MQSKSVAKDKLSVTGFSVTVLAPGQYGGNCFSLSQIKFLLPNEQFSFFQNSGILRLESHILS